MMYVQYLNPKDAIHMLQMKLEPSAVVIPCPFIDYYMARSAPVYALIYIYCLRVAGAVSIADLAGRFNLLESDVLQAWRHWEKEGLVAIEGDGADMNITFLPVTTPQQTETATGAVTADIVPVAISSAPLIRPVNERPQYEVQELVLYREKSREVERIFAKAEQTLGKLLTYHDMNLLFGLYDWLRIPVPVLEFLLDYCAIHEHRNLRYIEKCALDWTDQGIKDVEAARAYVQTFDGDYRAILRAIGQTNGYPTPTQRKYIDKWLKEWLIPAVLVLDACDRAAVQIGKPKLTYVDKIIARWHKDGINTLAGVQEAEANFAASSDSVKVKAPTAKPRTNRFANFTQRDNDPSQMEQLERAYIQQRLQG